MLRCAVPRGLSGQGIGTARSIRSELPEINRCLHPRIPPRRKMETMPIRPRRPHRNRRATRIHTSPTTAKICSGTTTWPTGIPPQQPETASIDPTVVTKPFVPPSPLPVQDNWTWTTSDGRRLSSTSLSKESRPISSPFPTARGIASINIADLSARHPEAESNYDAALGDCGASSLQAGFRLSLFRYPSREPTHRYRGASISGMHAAPLSGCSPADFKAPNPPSSPASSRRMHGPPAWVPEQTCIELSGRPPPQL